MRDGTVVLQYRHGIRHNGIMINLSKSRPRNYREFRVNPATGGTDWCDLCRFKGLYLRFFGGTILRMKLFSRVIDSPVDIGWPMAQIWRHEENK